MRDFYDLYTLVKTHAHEIDWKILKTAYVATCNKRESTTLIGRESEIAENIETYPRLSTLWAQYQQKYVYAAEISFSQVADSIRKILLYLE